MPEGLTCKVRNFNHLLGLQINNKILILVLQEFKRRKYYLGSAVVVYLLRQYNY